MVFVTASDHPVTEMGKLSFLDALVHVLIGPDLDSSLYTLFAQQLPDSGREMSVRVGVSSFECMCR
ncbi:transcriptional regulator, partial [Pseudomonas syringae pv. tagetis]